jgi:hypothetical protein
VYRETSSSSSTPCSSINQHVFLVFSLPMYWFSSAVGFVAMTVMNATTTLMIDLAPGQGSSVSACVRWYLLFR